VAALPRTEAARVVHLTAVHPADDVRIFAKECRSLAAAGYDVHLVAPAPADAVIDGVRLHACGGRGSGRLKRMTATVLAVYRKAVQLDADVYHVHDPELMPVALLLRLRGGRVVYDSHEHLPQQILTKPWIPALVRRPLAMLADVVERNCSRFVSAVVTAEPYVRRRFDGRAPTVVTVNNYPMLEEFPPLRDASGRERAVCYAGSITELRGAREMVDAIARTDAKLLLAGRFSPAGLERELRAARGWRQVEFLGHLSRDGLTRTLERSRAGLVVLHPIPNYVEANPTKMFEYMSAGIPVIASDFPAWTSIVDRHGCGLCVDPTSPSAIAEAIEWILDHPEEARQMGESGRSAVERLYNWDVEKRTLLDLYEQLAGRDRTEAGVLTAAAG
jgi:glycosyltransferase involved in cell wall biosynthesis